MIKQDYHNIIITKKVVVFLQKLSKNGSKVSTEKKKWEKIQNIEKKEYEY